MAAPLKPVIKPFQLEKKYGAEEASKLRVKIVQPDGVKIKGKIRIDRRETNQNHDGLVASFQPTQIGAHTLTVVIDDKAVPDTVRVDVRGPLPEIPSPPKTAEENVAERAVKTALAAALGPQYHQVDEDQLDKEDAKATTAPKSKDGSKKIKAKPQPANETDDKEARRALRAQARARLMAKQAAQPTADDTMVRSTLTLPPKSARGRPSDTSTMVGTLFSSLRRSKDRRMPACWLCAQDIKPKHGIKFMFHIYCSDCFRCVYIKPDRRQELINNALHAERITQDQAIRIPELELKGLTTKDVREAQALFKENVSYTAPQRIKDGDDRVIQRLEATVVRREAVEKLNVMLLRKIGEKTVTTDVQDDIQMIMNASPLKSLVTVQESEFLWMAGQLFAKWARSKQPHKSFKLTRSRKKPASPPPVPKPLNKFPQPGKITTPFGSHSADRWMMY